MKKIEKGFLGEVLLIAVLGVGGILALNLLYLQMGPNTTLEDNVKNLVALQEIVYEETGEYGDSVDPNDDNSLQNVSQISLLSSFNPEHYTIVTCDEGQSYGIQALNSTPTGTVRYYASSHDERPSYYQDNLKMPTCAAKVFNK